MRRVLLAAPLAVLVFAAPLSVSHGARDVSTCVQVNPESAAQGMVLQVHNTCDFAVQCELSWRGACDGDGPDEPPRPHRQTVQLAQAAERQLVASGAVCGERIWEITDDAWSCKEQASSL